MQLNVTTDYAIRIVLFLVLKKGIANSAEMAEAMGIPHSYILKITKVLKSVDILAEKRGINGGFVLKKSPEELTLLTIIAALEKTININRCLEEDKYCSRYATSYCKVRKLLCEAQVELFRRLDVKISEFI